MKKNKQAFIWVTLLILVIAGCSTNSSNEKSGEEESSSTGAKSISYTFGRNMDPNNEFVAKLEKLTGETFVDNRWTQLFKEKLNITVEYKMLSDSTSYDQKIKLAMASDDLPDMFQVTSLADMNQLMEADAVEELGALYEEHASDLLKSILEAETARVFEPASMGGKIYALPFKMPSTNGYNHLWIREDWLKKVGLERPKTMDDVYRIAQAFTQEDPDGNNQDDTFGLQIDKDFRYNMQGFFWGYGAYPHNGNWIDKNGRVVRGTVQEEMKKPLAQLQKMFNEGLLDMEFGSKDNGKSMESVVSGKTGMFYGPHWAAFTAEKSLANAPDAKWIVVPLPSESGDPVKIPLTISSDGYMVVKKGTANPENLIKMFNVYVEVLFGEKADFSRYNSSEGVDNIWQMGPIYTLDPMQDVRGHQEIKQALKDGTTDQLTGVAAGFYKNMSEGMWSFNMMFGPEDTPFQFVDQSYPDQIMWNAYMGAPTPTEVTRGSSLDELILTTLTSIIQGKTEVNKGFDDMVAEWKNLGGTQVEEEVNAALGK